MAHGSHRPDPPFALGIDRMTVPSLARIAAGDPVAVAPAAVERMAASRRVVERALAASDPVYGVSTGFGHLANTRIDPAEVEALQLNLVRSHAAGVGAPLPADAVRALLALRAHALALGQSGVRPEVVERLAAMLGRGVLPVVPEEGSVGASGDLAPLAHVALTLVGEGEAYWQGERMASAAALRRAGLEPLALSAKEGLALTNGSQLTAALGALTAARLDRILAVADIAAALSMQALRGIEAAYDARLLALRPHPGALRVGSRMRALLAASGLTTIVGAVRVQDAYSLRAVPQVHGAARDALGYVVGVLEIEMNAATDNPLVVGLERPEEAVILSGANFHGAPVALAMDILPVAMGQAAAISERRIERMVNPALSGGLPAFLTREPGLHSGLMVAQYTAAALTSAIKALAHPASVDSIPTSAGQEDDVSMGPVAALKARAIADRLSAIVAIECLTACQAVDLLEPRALSPATAAVHRLVRSAVPTLAGDRPVGPDIECVRALVDDGSLVAAAQDKVDVALADLGPG